MQKAKVQLKPSFEIKSQYYHITDCHQPKTAGPLRGEPAVGAFWATNSAYTLRTGGRRGRLGWPRRLAAAAVVLPVGLLEAFDKLRVVVGEQANGGQQLLLDVVAGGAGGTGDGAELAGEKLDSARRRGRSLVSRGTAASA